MEICGVIFSIEITCSFLFSMFRNKNFIFMRFEMRKNISEQRSPEIPRLTSAAQCLLNILVGYVEERPW